MRTTIMSRLCRKMRILLVACALYQFPGACNLSELTASTTTTTVLNTQDVILSLVRAAILTPLDQALTSVVGNFFDNLNDE